jgi:hypothetical protein
MRERPIRIALMLVDLLLALSATVGAVGLVVGYMNIPLSGLRGTPFVDYTVPALLLGLVVGGSALVAAAIALFWPRKLVPRKLVPLGLAPLRMGPLASAAAGGIMVGWMVVEIAMLGLVLWVQAFYLAVGLVMIGLAILLQRAESQQRAEPYSPAATDRPHAHAA